MPLVFLFFFFYGSVSFYFTYFLIPPPTRQPGEQLVGILVPWSGIKPMVLAMEAQNPNY